KRLQSCAPQAIGVPSSNPRACARYGNGTQTAHAAFPFPGISRSKPLSNFSLPARLPLSFQLPTTIRDRIATLKTHRFYRETQGGLKSPTRNSLERHVPRGSPFDQRNPAPKQQRARPALRAIIGLDPLPGAAQRGRVAERQGADLCKPALHP